MYGHNASIRMQMCRLSGADHHSVRDASPVRVYVDAEAGRQAADAFPFSELLPAKGINFVNAVTFIPASRLKRTICPSIIARCDTQRRTRIREEEKQTRDIDPEEVARRTRRETRATSVRWRRDKRVERKRKKKMGGLSCGR